MRMDPEIRMCMIPFVFAAIGLIPFWLVKYFKSKASGKDFPSKAKNILSGLTCFGAGVFISTAFTQILPEVHDGFARLQHGESVTASLPLGEICFIAGFSLAYLSEKLARWLKAKEIQNKINGSIQKLVGVGKSTQSYDDKIVPRHPNPDVVDTCEMNLCVQQLAKDYYKKSTTTSQIHLAISAEQAVSSCNGIALGYHHQHYQHTIDDADRVTPSIRGMLIVINLLLNEIFEGMAVGLEDSTRNLNSLFTTIAPHKFMIVFCVGLEMANSGVNVSTHIMRMGMFSLFLSSGSVIGTVVIFVDAHKDFILLASLALQGMAGGTLLYLAVYKVLERERSKSTVRFLKEISVALGFLALVGLQALSF